MEQPHKAAQGRYVYKIRCDVHACFHPLCCEVGGGSFSLDRLCWWCSVCLL